MLFRTLVVAVTKKLNRAGVLAKPRRRWSSRPQVDVLEPRILMSVDDLTALVVPAGAADHSSPSTSDATDPTTNNVTASQTTQTDGTVPAMVVTLPPDTSTPTPETAVTNTDDSASAVVDSETVPATTDASTDTGNSAPSMAVTTPPAPTATTPDATSCDQSEGSNTTPEDSSCGTTTAGTTAAGATTAGPATAGTATATNGSASAPTLLTGSAQEDVDVAQILEDASTQLTNAGVTPAEIQLRLAIVEAILLSQTISPTDAPDGESFRPLPWTDGGDPDASFTVSCGFNNVVPAFVALWTPTTDGSPTGALWCASQAQAIYIMGFLQTFTQTDNSAGINSVIFTVGDSSISDVIENFVTAVPLNTTLKPGDWVWFQNPYYAPYMAQVTQLLAEAAQQFAAGNDTLAKALEAQAAELANAVQGEAGHNCIYLGQTADGEAIFSLYGEVQTQSEIQNAMANLDGDPTNNWVSVQWAEHMNDLVIVPADFGIGGIQSPNLSNFPLTP